MHITPEEANANLKSLATWIERLPPGSRLMDPTDTDICLVPDTSVTSQILRLFLPSEGHA